MNSKDAGSTKPKAPNSGPSNTPAASEECPYPYGSPLWEDWIEDKNFGRGAEMYRQVKALREAKAKSET